MDLKIAATTAGANYDALPYVSHPFPQMQPARLAGLARLFGLQPPEVTRACVLEIGCASAGHLIPLAARFPQARFVGLDPSAVQILEGQARAQALGLSNIDLRAAGVEALGAADGPFDYVLCHGVYSWVPDAVRAAILAAIGDRLAPSGVAYVSFNVLPGWRLLQALRDSLIGATAGIGDLRERVAKARDLLELMRRGTDVDTVWGRLWRDEAERLSSASDDYLAHEFLETENAPCTFTDFMTAAGAHGLAYLAEAELFTMLPENNVSGVAEDLRQFAGNRLAAVEQMLDLVNGRTFRQTLLVKSAQAALIDRRLDPERLRGLHLVAPLDLEAEPLAQDGSRTWRDEAGRSITTADPHASAAIDRLVARLPASSTATDLLRGLKPAGREAALDALFRMLTVGLIDALSEPVLAATRPDDHPRVFALARQDALRGATSTASLRHEIVELDDAARLILPLADGSRDAAAIQGEIEKVHEIKGLSSAAHDLVELTLLWAARTGLLDI